MLENFRKTLKRLRNEGEEITNEFVTSLILGKEVQLLGNSNSHNYGRYADESGVIIFDNEFMITNVSDGVLNGAVERGNTISFSDFALVDQVVMGITRESILKEISKETKIKLETEKKLNELNDKLEYFNTLGKDKCTVEEYTAFVVKNLANK